MDKEKRDKIIKVMDMVAKDVEADAHNFEGKEFNGRNVATYLGNLGAGVAAVANAVKAILEAGKETPPELNISTLYQTAIQHADPDRFILDTIKGAK